MVVKDKGTQTQRWVTCNNSESRGKELVMACMCICAYYVGDDVMIQVWL